MFEFIQSARGYSKRRAAEAGALVFLDDLLHERAELDAHNSLEPWQRT
jgi:hypothetical protein